MSGQIVLNEKLFEEFTKNVIMCVREIVESVDKKLNKKYLENCRKT